MAERIYEHALIVDTKKVMTRRQLECRIVLTYRAHTTDIGMYDPVSGRYEPLGSHARADVARVVRDLATSIQRAGHRLTFAERSAT